MFSLYMLGESADTRARAKEINMCVRVRARVRACVYTHAYAHEDTYKDACLGTWIACMV